MPYLVPTKSGEKGPFSVDQLQGLVDAGRLPLTATVIDQETGLQLDVSDICAPPAPPRSEQTPAAAKSEEAPAPRRAQRPTASGRGARRSAPRGGGGARSGNAPSRGTPPRRSAPRRSGLSYDRPKKKLGCLAWIGIAAIVGLLIGAGGCWWFFSEVKDYVDNEMHIEGGVLKSEKYSYEVRVPNHWKRMTWLIPGSDVAAGRMHGEDKDVEGFYVIIPPGVEAATFDLRGGAEVFAQEMSTEMANSTVSPPRQMTIDDLPCVHYRVTGDEDGVRVNNDIYMIVGREVYVMMTIGSEARAAELDDMFKRVVLSFDEI